MINAEVQRHGNENVAGLMRRFSRKMQSSGVLRRARKLRYHTNKPSYTKRKQEALTRIERTKKYVDLFKLGREPVNKKGGRRR